MVSRLGLLLRGPAPIFGLIAVVAIITALIKGVGASGGHHTAAPGARTSTPRPAATRTPTPSPTLTSTPRPRPTRTPRARTPVPTTRPTPKPAPTRLSWTVASTGAGTLRNALTQVQVRVHRVQVRRRGGGIVALLLNVTVRTLGASSPYSARDFFAIASDGATYSAAVTHLHRHLLGSGLLRAHAAARGWIGFRLPVAVQTGSVVWNDGSRLIPPGTLLQYRIGQRR